MSLKRSFLIGIAFQFILSFFGQTDDYHPQEIFDNLEVITSENASAISLIGVREMPVLGVNSIVFNYNGTLMGVAANESIYLFETQNMEMIKVLKSEQGAINDLSAAPSSNLIISANANGSISVWDLDNENSIVFSDDSDTELITVSISSDADILASSGYDQVITLWDFESQGLLTRLENSVDDEVYITSQINITTLDFNSQGYLIAAGGSSPIVFLYNANTNHLLWQTEWDVNISRNLDTAGIVTGVEFSPDGKYIAYSYLGSVDEGSYMRVLDARDGSLVIELKDDNFNRTALRTISFNSTGDLLVAGDYPIDEEQNEDGVNIWNWQVGEIITTLPGHQLHVEDISFNPSGTILVTADNSSKLFLWGVQEESDIEQNSN